MFDSLVIELSPENVVDHWETRLSAVWMHGEVSKTVRRRVYAELQATAAFRYELTSLGYPRVLIRPEQLRMEADEDRLALKTLIALTEELEEYVVLARHEEFCRLRVDLVTELEEAAAHLQVTYDRVVKETTVRPEAWASRVHRMIVPYGRVGDDCVQVELSAHMHPQLWHDETAHRYEMLVSRIYAAELALRAFIPPKRRLCAKLKMRK